MRLSTLTFIFLLLSKLTFAQGIKGYVKDENNQPLEYANVLIKNTTKGTTSNLQGYYELKLEAGSYQIVFQYVGYQTLVEEITVKNDWITKNIVLKSLQSELKEVSILPGEEPAIPIIKNCIASRKQHWDAIENSECKVYIKGINRMLKSPKKFMGQDLGIDGLDSNGKGVLYFSEVVSNYAKAKPDKVKETVIASKVSGSNNGISFNRAMYFDFDVREEKLDIFGFTLRDLISPIADNAFFYYQYFLYETYNENGYTIHKIKFKPKRKHDPCFMGFLYIVDGSWQVYATDFTILKNEHINLLDTLSIKQVFAPADSQVWVPISQHFYFNAKFMVININGNYDAFYSDYIVNKKIEKKTFNNEISNVDELATKLDSAYWRQIRPVPLTLEEVKDYIDKDSIRTFKRKKENRDSVRQENNKFKIANLFNGYSYKNKKRQTYSINSILEMISYNSMHTWLLVPEFSFRKRSKNSLAHFASAALGYSVGKKTYYPVLTYRISRYNSFLLSLQIGKSAFQFDNENPVWKTYNTFSTLFFGNNILKLYSSEFIKFTHLHYIKPGLHFKQYFMIENRENLNNVITNSTIKPSKIFSPNLNFNEFDEIAKWNFQIQWTPATLYMSLPRNIIEMGSKFPTFTLSNTFTIEKNKSYINIFTLGFEKNIKTGFLGSLQVQNHFGLVINQSTSFNPDIYFLTGNKIPVILNEDFFTNLNPYYGLTYNFIRGRIEQNMNNFIFNKIPLLRKLKLNNQVGVRYYFGFDNKLSQKFNYGEPYISIAAAMFPMKFYLSTSFQNFKILNGVNWGIQISFENNNEVQSVNHDFRM